MSRLIVSVTHQVGNTVALRCECGTQMLIESRDDDNLSTVWTCGGCGKRWLVRDVSVQADELPPLDTPRTSAAY